MHPFVNYVEQKRLYENFTKDTIMKFVFADVLNAAKQYDQSRSARRENSLDVLSKSIDGYIKMVRRTHENTKLKTINRKSTYDIYIAILVILCRMYLFTYSYMKLNENKVDNINGILNISPARLRILTKEIPDVFSLLIKSISSYDKEFGTWGDRVGNRNGKYGIDDIINELIMSVLVVTCKNNITDVSGVRDSQYYISHNNLIRKVLDLTNSHRDNVIAVNKALQICESITSYDVFGVYYKHNFNSISMATCSGINANLWISNFFIRISIMGAVQLIAPPSYGETIEEVLYEGFPFGYPDEKNNGSLYDLILRTGVPLELMEEKVNESINFQYNSKHEYMKNLEQLCSRFSFDNIGNMKFEDSRGVTDLKIEEFQDLESSDKKIYQKSKDSSNSNESSNCVFGKDTKSSQEVENKDNTETKNIARTEIEEILLGCSKFEDSYSSEGEDGEEKEETEDKSGCDDDRRTIMNTETSQKENDYIGEEENIDNSENASYSDVGEDLKVEIKEGDEKIQDADTGKQNLNQLDRIGDFKKTDGDVKDDTTDVNSCSLSSFPPSSCISDNNEIVSEVADNIFEDTKKDVNSGYIKNISSSEIGGLEQDDKQDLIKISQQNNNLEKTSELKIKKESSSHTQENSLENRGSLHSMDLINENTSGKTQFSRVNVKKGRLIHRSKSANIKKNIKKAIKPPCAKKRPHLGDSLRNSELFGSISPSLPFHSPKSSGKKRSAKNLQSKKGRRSKLDDNDAPPILKEVDRELSKQFVILQTLLNLNK